MKSFLYLKPLALQRMHVKGLTVVWLFGMTTTCVCAYTSDRETPLFAYGLLSHL